MSPWSAVSRVLFYVYEDTFPLQLNAVMRVKMPPGKAQEGVILMENIVKSFSWRENRLGWVWCPLAQTSPEPDLWCGVGNGSEQILPFWRHPGFDVLQQHFPQKPCVSWSSQVVEEPLPNMLWPQNGDVCCCLGRQRIVKTLFFSLLNLA